jgi:hypothetical protein
MVRALTLALAVVVSAPASASAQSNGFAYRVLATSKTSSMQKEMNEAAAAGYRFGAVMGGETTFGGSEVLVVMLREGRSDSRFDYRLLATSKTSTMQKELQEAADLGFDYKGQTVFKSAFGGREVVVILERDRDADRPFRYEYKLIATMRTGTMQGEITDAGEHGYEFVGLTVGETALGGKEVVAILRRRATPTARQ